MIFFEEIKRHIVFRIGIAYTVTAWLLLQVTDIVYPRIGLPGSAVTLVIALLVIGFIPALKFAHRGLVKMRQVREVKVEMSTVEKAVFCRCSYRQVKFE